MLVGRSNGAVLATGGMHADGVALVKRLEQRLEVNQIDDIVFD
jgi:hypothetical protein